MKFLERSFVEDASYRPRPIVHWNEEEGLLIVATPWGQETLKEELINKLQDYISSSKLDHELTSPFPALNNYDKAANSIRTALLLANESIYKSKNKNEYTSGFEILVGVVKNSQFYFATVGHPHVLLSKKEKNILPLFMDIDHSLNLSKKKLLPALPDKLLGINSQVDFQVHSFKYQKGDQLILMSKSWIPKDFFSLSKKQRNFDDYAKELTKDDQQPFWLGLMEF
jgi:hypothetical protein